MLYFPKNKSNLARTQRNTACSKMLEQMWRGRSFCCQRSWGTELRPLEGDRLGFAERLVSETWTADPHVESGAPTSQRALLGLRTALLLCVSRTPELTVLHSTGALVAFMKPKLHASWDLPIFEENWWDYLSPHGTNTSSQTVKRESSLVTTAHPSPASGPRCLSFRERNQGSSQELLILAGAWDVQDDAGASDSSGKEEGTQTQAQRTRTYTQTQRTPHTCTHIHTHHTPTPTSMHTHLYTHTSIHTTHPYPHPYTHNIHTTHIHTHIIHTTHPHPHTYTQHTPHTCPT